jgi:hypothetical protein
MPDTLRGETPDQLHRRLDNTAALIKTFRQDVALFHRMGQHPATDPYPTSVRAKDTPGGASDSTPTERAALNDHTIDDRIGRYIEDFNWGIRELDRIATAMEGLRQVIHAGPAKHFGRQDTTTTCEICDRTVAGTPQDRLRSGMCMSDYQAWRRYCDTTLEPSREQFARMRRDETRQAS